MPTTTTHKQVLPTLAALGVGFIGSAYLGALSHAAWSGDRAFVLGTLAGTVAVAAVGGVTVAGKFKADADAIAGMRERLQVANQRSTTATRARDSYKSQLQHIEHQLETLHRKNAEHIAVGRSAAIARDAALKHTQMLEARLSASGGLIATLQSQLERLSKTDAEWNELLDQELSEQLAAQRQQALGEAKQRFDAHRAKITNAIPAAVRKKADKELQKWIAAHHAPLLEQLQTLEAERSHLLSEITALRAQVPNLMASLEASYADDAEAQAFLKTIDQLTEGVAERDRRIQALEEQVQELQATLNEPRLFGDGSALNRGNRLIEHALEQGIVLDGVDKSVTPDKGTHTFWFINKLDGVPEEVLNTLNRDITKLRDHLEALEPVQFRYDPERLLYYAKVVVNKRVVTRDDVDRLWQRPSKFPALVKGVSSFRVIAPPGGAKSPTIRNILGAKLLNGEKFDLRRYDPSAGSQKDFWRVAPTWDSYETATLLASDIYALISDRQQQKKTDKGIKFPWVFFVIDELDNTLTNQAHETIPVNGKETPVPEYLMNAVSMAIKEGQHLSIGVFLCTQTPNTRQLMKSENIDKAFFNNVAQVVLEANVFDFMNKQEDGTKHTQLVNDFRTLLDWCDVQNAPLAAEDKKYRPALLVYKGKRTLMQLPIFGDFGFDKCDPSEPYDFERFNAYDYGDSSSLDKCLMGERTPRPMDAQPHSTTVPPATHQPSQPTPDATGSNLLSISNTPVLVAAKIPRECPKCGGKLKDCGISDKKSSLGKRRLVCTNKLHTKSLGIKTFYFDVTK